MDRKFSEDSKNVLKIAILLLQVGFTGNFESDFFQTVFLAVQILTLFFSLTVPNLAWFSQVCG